VGHACTHVSTPARDDGKRQAGDDHDYDHRDVVNRRRNNRRQGSPPVVVRTSQGDPECAADHGHDVDPGHEPWSLTLDGHRPNLDPTWLMRISAVTHVESVPCPSRAQGRIARSSSRRAPLIGTSVRESLGQTRLVITDEEDFERALNGMRRIWVRATGESHAHLDALLDTDQRRDPATTNYLASGAAGTLRDRFFTPINGDHLTEAEVARVNREYVALLEAASESATRLALPAVRNLRPAE